jgi:hypothetical protein
MADLAQAPRAMALTAALVAALAEAVRLEELAHQGKAKMVEIPMQTRLAAVAVEALQRLDRTPMIQTVRTAVLERHLRSPDLQSPTLVAAEAQVTRTAAEETDRVGLAEAALQAIVTALQAQPTRVVAAVAAAREPMVATAALAL